MRQGLGLVRCAVEVRCCRMSLMKEAPVIRIGDTIGRIEIAESWQTFARLNSCYGQNVNVCAASKLSAAMTLGFCDGDTTGQRCVSSEANSATRF